MDIKRTVAGVGAAIDSATDRLTQATSDPSPTGQRDATDADAATFVRREERLRTGTVRVPVERVRVTKHVVVEQVTRVVEVRREELRVETLPVSAGSELSGAAGNGQPIEMVLFEEEVEVVKRLVHRERVRISVERIAEQQSDAAELRREEVVVEPIGSIQPVD